MRSFLLLLFCTLLQISFAQTAWVTDFQQAKNQAVSSNKFILLNFSGSDWCGPCIKMKKEILSASSFLEFAATDLILVNADFPRLKKNAQPKEVVQQNEKLAEQYNPQGIFPCTLLLNTQGKVLKTWDGFPGVTPEQFTQQISEIIHAGN